MLFEKFRLKVAKKRMAAEISTEDRNVRITHFDEAKSILILFNAEEASDYDAISSLVRLFDQNKSKTTCIGYTSAKAIPEVFQMRPSTSVFIQKDLNYFFQPPIDQREFVRSRKFDLVINLDMSRSFPLYYLSAIARANFKIGSGNEHQSCFDFMLNVNTDTSVRFFIEQIKIYLNLMKKAS
jgi:hypothetical protein